MSDKGRNSEPALWALFGAGGTMAALFVVPTVLVLGVLMPAGVFGSEGFSHDSLRQLISCWPVALIITGVLFSTVWLCSHRIYHGLLDLGLHPPLAIKVCIYGVAVVAAAVALFACLAA